VYFLPNRKVHVYGLNESAANAGRKCIVVLGKAARCPHIQCEKSAWKIIKQVTMLAMAHAKSLLMKTAMKTCPAKTYVE